MTKTSFSCQFVSSWEQNFKKGQNIAAFWLQPLKGPPLDTFARFAVVNISIVFGMVVMPLTYYPILRTASEKNVMGTHVNGKFDDVVGWLVLVLVAIACVAAIPLMMLTQSDNRKLLARRIRIMRPRPKET
jgi:hypothetical protein